MTIHFFLLLLVSFIQFALSALWYSPLLFGKTWMKIMGSHEKSKEELQKMQKEMLPFYFLQFVLTLMTTAFYALFLRFLPFQNAVPLMFFFWGMVVMPTQVSMVIWGNTPKKYWLKQVAITSGASLMSMLLITVFFAAK